jgi:putative hydrolase of the HAD superfamily
VALGGLGPILGEDVEAVLLDGLGTLVVLEAPWLELRRKLGEDYGLELGLGDAEHAFRAEMAYYRAHHHEGRNPRALADLRHRCAEVLRAQLPAEVAGALSLAQLTETMLGALRFSAYPDALAVLPTLRARGLALVVVSNWDVSLPAILQQMGLAQMVDGVVTSAQVGTPKPDRGIFTAALTLADSTPQRTVHVGDSIEHDVRGALAAGIAPVLLCREVRWGLQQGRRQPHHADGRLAHGDAWRLKGVTESQGTSPEVPVIASLAELLT